MNSTARNTAIDPFIARWQDAGGSERANYQLFITELCALLEVPLPDPAREDTAENAYVFERRISFHHGDGSTSNGFADCYRRDAFVLEAKKLRQGVQTKGFDDAMLRARAQGESYARALPAAEGRVPFVLVVDVGHVIEVYAEFTRSGATYTPFPDPRSHRIRLDDLRDADIRQRLRQVWLEPLALDPARASAKATRAVAAQLAEVAKSLEAAGHHAERVAAFLTRCLFSMFAEDVGLLPQVNGEGAFLSLLKQHRAKPDVLGRMLADLWRAMDRGDFAASIAADVLHFNGKLFKQPDVLPLNAGQIDLLIDAAHADWKQVEPAIFGTLLERALDPVERHALGAHYTPRAYVERLVMPTVVEPLRADWANIQAAALLLMSEGKNKEAIATVENFRKQLCTVRVLDPACGSGNFLYVALEHLKRLEGEVLNQLEALGDTQQRIEAEGLTVDPHQFLGIEKNERAAAVAELVLWIGYLQWHFRTRAAGAAAGLPPQPVLKDFCNIECRDAVLAWDGIEYVTDTRGVPVTRWDGRTLKRHPVTSEEVPDDSAQIPIERYLKPRKAVWPDADFIVGNPPFIGPGPMRSALGDGYVEALRGVWKDVPESADFVMFWWHHAAETTRKNKARRFGFITTNSLRQTFNRRVVTAQLEAKPALSLAFALPDHPWVDSADGAAVRIAMSVGQRGKSEGRLLTLNSEQLAEEGEYAVTLVERNGRIHADLSIGADVSSANALQANANISSPGLKLHGAGFIVTPDEAVRLLPSPQPSPRDRGEGAAHLGTPSPASAGEGRGEGRFSSTVIRPYRNGRDLTDTPRNVMVIDLLGLSANEVRQRYPSVYQHVLQRVKPERDQNARATYRDNWWIHGEPRRELRKALAGLSRYIATVETAKHRTFQFLDAAIAPDNMLVVIALDDAHYLGVLSSIVHVTWAIAAGGTLEDRPRYNKSRCFEPFPFPDANSEQQTRIRTLAEELDAHRKRVQASTGITLTQMYNVLEALRSGRALTAKERTLHEDSLVGVLQSLHDDLDHAVLAAYGWSDLETQLHTEAGRAALLERLVALNAQCAAKEARGQIRWFRPAFQNAAAVPVQVEIDVGDQPVAALVTTEKQAWPKTLPEQMAAVAALLMQAATPLDIDAIATHFIARGTWKKRLPQIVDTLVALGRVQRDGNHLRALQQQRTVLSE